MSAFSISGRNALRITLVVAAGLTGCNDKTWIPTANKHLQHLYSPRPAATVIDVTKVDLGTSVNSIGAINNPSATFKPSEPVYVAVTTERPGHNVELKAKWTYQDDSVVKEIAKTVNPTDTLVTDFEIANDVGWPRGRYKVQIFVNGQMSAVTEYTVNP